MNIRDLVLSKDRLDEAVDLEARLLSRKTNATIIGWISAATIFFQLVVVLWNFVLEVGDQSKVIQDYFRNHPVQAVLFIFFVLLLLFSLLLRYTNIFIKESKSPFKYTFYIEPFLPIQAGNGRGPEVNDTVLSQLMHHDLTERLNNRIKRFSVLENCSDDQESKEGGKLIKSRLSSHIQVFGNYVFRATGTNQWTVQVMPKIRIGGPGEPYTLAQTVRFDLPTVIKREGEGEHLVFQFGPDIYEVLVERVYSIVATEVYSRIEKDVHQKIKLFPTKYLKALALYHEAEDFSRSNTIDGYEKARDLYVECITYFERSRIHSPRIRRMLRLQWRSVWKETNYIHFWAKAVIGFAKCQLYINHLAGISGRKKNTLFDIPGRMKQVIERLEKIHLKNHKFKEKRKASFLIHALGIGPSRKLGVADDLLDDHRKTLFEAYLVDALACSFLGAPNDALSKVKWAEVTFPQERNTNPFYMLVKGLIEPDGNKSILYLQRAVEIEPNFQMARWFLALQLEIDFRRKDEITSERVKSVIHAFEEVLKINAGNISAMASQGYLLWLVENELAKKVLLDGCEVKALSRDIYTGDLLFRLARIAAENGDFNLCRDRYLEASATEPSIGTFINLQNSRTQRTDYDFIQDKMFSRFEKYKLRTEKCIAEKRKKEDVSGLGDEDNSIKMAHAFMLNDYGNACLRFFHFHGDWEKLYLAVLAYKKATEIYPEFAVAWYNLQNAYGWQGEWSEVGKCMESAGRFAGNWPLMEVLAAQHWFMTTEGNLQEILDLMVENRKKIATLTQKENLGDEKEKTEKEKLDSEWQELQSKYNERFFRPLKTIQNNSSLAPLYEGEVSVLVDRLTHIPWSMVQPDEVVIQVELAKILAKHYDVAILEDALRLVRHLQQVFVEDHELLSQEKELLVKIAIHHAKRLFREFAASSKWSVQVKRAFGVLLEKWEGKEILGRDTHKQFFINEILVLMESLASFLSQSGDITDTRMLRFYKQIRKDFYDKTLWVLLDNYDGLMMRIFEMLQMAAGSSQMLSRSALPDLTKQFRQNRRKIIKLLDYWLVSEEGSFLSIYWFIQSGRKTSLKQLDKLKTKTFSLHPERFENLLGNAYNQCWVIFSNDKVNSGRGFLTLASNHYENALSLSPTVAKHHFQIGVVHARLEEWGDASKEFYHAYQIQYQNPVYQAMLAEAFYRLGTEHLVSKRFEDAIAAFDQALIYRPEEAKYHFQKFRTYEQRGYINDKESLVLAKKSLEQAMGLSEEFRLNQTVRYRELLRKEKMMDKFGEDISRPVLDVLQILIYYGEDIRPLIFDETGNHLKRAIIDFSQNIQDYLLDNYGVQIPQILFHSQHIAAAPNYYYFYLNGALVTYGSILTDGVFTFLEGKDEKDLLPLVGNPPPVVDPFTGKTGYFVSQDHIQVLEEKQTVYWESIKYLFWHLKATLISNLPDFMGYQETIEWLIKGNKIFSEERLDPVDLGKLAVILKSLLAEAVGVNQYAAILQYFLDYKRQKSVFEMINEIRLLPEMKPNLPGNKPGHIYYRLGSGLEKIIVESVTFQGDLPVLSLSLEHGKKIYDLLIAEVKEPHAVLLVTDTFLRPFVKKFMEKSELTFIPVLAEAEILTAPDERQVKVLDFGKNAYV